LANTAVTNVIVRIKIQTGMGAASVLRMPLCVDDPSISIYLSIHIYIYIYTYIYKYIYPLLPVMVPTSTLSLYYYLQSLTPRQFVSCLSHLRPILTSSLRNTTVSSCEEASAARLEFLVRTNTLSCHWTTHDSCPSRI
jgi:hypothetical protein